MGALITDDKFEKKLAKLREHAELNPFSLEFIERSVKGLERPIGDLPSHTVFLPVHYLVSFSVEDHPSGRMRHCSISTASSDKLPNPYVVYEITQRLGIKADFREMKPQKGAQVVEDGRAIGIYEKM